MMQTFCSTPSAERTACAPVFFVRNDDLILACRRGVAAGGVCRALGRRSASKLGWWWKDDRDGETTVGLVPCFNVSVVRGADRSDDREAEPDAVAGVGPLLAPSDRLQRGSST